MSKQIVLSHLHKGYGSKQVLKDLSLSLPMKENISLMGPSGCGKTTLLRLLLGLERPDSGGISVPGTLSVVFQEDRLLLRQSALANLYLVAGSKGRQRSMDLLEQLGLSVMDASLPSKQLSGGMKRRVSIARALLAPFDYLLLDEPFKGLDDATRSLCAGLILREAAGRGLLLVSHDPMEAAILNARIIQVF